MQDTDKNLDKIGIITERTVPMTSGKHEKHKKSKNLTKIVLIKYHGNLRKF